jgi:hypothetical protein
MCLFKTPKPKDPVLPPEPAQMREPDAGAVRDGVGRRTTDRMRAAAQTVLTSGSGVTNNAPTQKKTLLGA